MKRLFAVLLVCVMCLGLCACGESASLPETSDMLEQSVPTEPTEQEQTISITAENIHDYFGFNLSATTEKNQYFNTYTCSVTIESYLKSSAELHNVEVIYKVGYVKNSAINTTYSNQPLNANYQQIFDDATDLERNNKFALERDVVFIPASGNLSKTYTWGGSDKSYCYDTHLVYTIVDARGEITLM